MKREVNISANRVIVSLAIFLFMSFVIDNLSDGARDIVLPIVMIGLFAWSAKKTPPIAIMILLYYSMIQGGWFILLAAPITILLARRYQRQRLKLDLNPTHIRRTVLLAVAAMAATLPFIAASLGAWSANSPASPSSSASPLISRRAPGDESALQRFAWWVGFGPDGNPPVEPGQLVPRPVQPLSPPDDSFNWWLLVGIAVVLALLALAWWLWRRLQRTPTPVFEPVRTAPALARLEAVGERIGRPRAAHEGAITYSQELARATGDDRIATVGPLVSGQVYQSAFANPRRTGDTLTHIETAPPPLPPPPSRSERFQARMASLPSNRAIGYGLAVLIALALVGWLVVPRLGELQSNRFESGLGSALIDASPTAPRPTIPLFAGSADRATQELAEFAPIPLTLLEQSQVVPFATEHVDHL